MRARRASEPWFSCASRHAVCLTCAFGLVSIARISPGRSVRFSAGSVELRRLLVLHAPDAAEVVVAIGPHRGVGGAVLRPARVVVDDGLVVEVDDVERAVGTDARFDRAEPHVAAAHELGLLAALLFFGRVADTVGLHELVMHDVERRLAGEVAVAPLLRPRAAVVDRASGGGGELADLIDLDVGLLRPRHARIRRLAGDHALPRRRARQPALGEHRLGEHGVEEHRAARRLRPEHLTVPRDVEAPGVAAAAAVLLEGAAVGLEAHDAAAVAAEVLRSVGRGDRADAVAVRGVDPAVETPAQVVDDGVRVEGAEARVELRALVGDLVAVGVLEIPDVGRRRRDDAVACRTRTR